ncbi:DUF1298 domain-containing protein [Nocardia uniformis]|uniref:diacylglycerol O-acyltransferase n=1 Tax=Nocardia uniformis TaxID=53432 RepID=A0A849BYY1_9NOCA|nr:wax ester/triacylglycerol synthase domain-containing protein [Nocardia uniformis]NNH69315.1 DUF1298 domain-containing protein [Nocardia uniformis]
MAHLDEIPTLIDRASPTDRAFLAMDTGDVPEQFGVVLTLEHASTIDLPRVRQSIGERVHTVPRLRQRLTRTPFGCGGPIWVDDPGFDIRTHVRALTCPEPADEQALLDAALAVIVTPLPKNAPLWSVVLVSGLRGGGCALVVVLHHVLADGVGGLAVLANLTDTLVAAPAYAFPRSAPARALLVRDACTRRLRAIHDAARSWRLLRTSLEGAGGIRPPRISPGSLNQRAGSRLRLAVVRADRTAIRTAAHRHGATTNDAVLVATAAALRKVLVRKGESVDPLVATVPVSGRRPETGSALGNMVSPMLVSVPTTGTLPDRLQRVADQVRVHRAAATGPPPIALLGWLFRPLAALGGYRWYMNHQHRFHTLISHVRGPDEPVTFGGVPVTSAIPIGVGPSGNTPVYFEMLSYAGTLVVTTAADPDHFPDLTELTAALRAEFDHIIGDNEPSSVDNEPSSVPPTN